MIVRRERGGAAAEAGWRRGGLMLFGHLCKGTFADNLLIFKICTTRISLTPERKNGAPTGLK
jgi:hypothetical protein